MGEIATMPEADRGWMIDTLLALLQTPSPSGRTDAVMQLIGDIFNDFRSEERRVGKECSS